MSHETPKLLHKNQKESNLLKIKLKNLERQESQTLIQCDKQIQILKEETEQTEPAESIHTKVQKSQLRIHRKSVQEFNLKCVNWLDNLQKQNSSEKTSGAVQLLNKGTSFFGKDWNNSGFRNTPGGISGKTDDHSSERKIGSYYAVSTSYLWLCRLKKKTEEKFFHREEKSRKLKPLHKGGFSQSFDLQVPFSGVRHTYPQFTSHALMLSMRERNKGLYNSPEDEHEGSTRAEEHMQRPLLRNNNMVLVNNDLQKSEDRKPVNGFHNGVTNINTMSPNKRYSIDVKPAQLSFSCEQNASVSEKDSIEVAYESVLPPLLNRDGSNNLINLTPVTQKTKSTRLKKMEEQKTEMEDSTDIRSQQEHKPVLGKVIGIDRDMKSLNIVGNSVTKISVKNKCSNSTINDSTSYALDNIDSSISDGYGNVGHKNSADIQSIANGNSHSRVLGSNSPDSNKVKIKPKSIPYQLKAYRRDLDRRMGASYYSLKHGIEKGKGIPQKNVRQQFTYGRHFKQRNPFTK